MNKYLQFDTLMIAVQYLSYAIAGIPYMGVGRNLAYRKSLFYKNKGFASHYGLLSGDDDLFVNETATRENTAVEFHPDSHTLSIPELSWKAWFTQKCRHMSTSVITSYSIHYTKLYDNKKEPDKPALFCCYSNSTIKCSYNFV